MCIRDRITLASLLLSVEDVGSLSFSPGSLLVLLACLCWGLENNCTRVLSVKDPMQIVVLKGFGAGLGALLTAFILGQTAATLLPAVLALLLGFTAYGLSIFFYIHAQRTLGAARTSAYYAFAPFIGVGLSALLYGQPLTATFLAALALMVCGAWLAARENHSHPHIHPQVSHEHRHRHDDGHHNHPHPVTVRGAHSHAHLHEPMEHTHPHTPDLHHAHAHPGKAKQRTTK
jgi:drug/metabolite transporter (DMT)-like permease